MNVLYILQQSVYTNNQKWTSADSNIQMMRGIINEIISQTSDIHFHVLIGRLKDFEDIESYDELINSPRVTFYGYPFPVDAFLNRQHFDTSLFNYYMFNILPKIDIIWNNITELSRNIKTWMYYRKYKAKLITSCYWLDCPLINEEKVPFGISYMWRQFDGFLCSDLVTFTCDSTYKAFIKNADKMFATNYINDILQKSKIFDFGFSAFELNKFKKYSRTNPSIIMFLNRISGINYTHHEEFIEAINLLYKKRKDFKVVFTNPSNKINPNHLKSQVPNYENFLNKDHKIYSRAEYIQLLKQGSISVHLFDTERYGGCAHRESIHCENLPITLKLHEYKRIQGLNYPFYLNNFEPQEIASVLNQALQDIHFTKTIRFKKIQERNYESSYEFQGSKITQILRRLIS